MICKGASRGAGGQLASYLGDYLQAEKNLRVELLEIRGSAFTDLTRSISSWETEAQNSRCQKPLWHAQIAPRHGEVLTREQQFEAVAILERHHGLQGQPRAVVAHTKHDGSEHLHVVWSRYDRSSGKARSDSFSKRKNAAASREMEERFGLEKLANPEFHSDDKTKSREERRQESRKGFDYGDFQRAKRNGFDPRERSETITRLWRESDSGKALRAALLQEGYVLAHGDRRSYVVVDRAGDIHSLARQIKGALKKDVDERLTDLDPASIPKAVHISQQLRHAFLEQHPEARRTSQPSSTPREVRRPATEQAAARKPSPFDKPPDRNPLDPATILAALTERQSTFTMGDMEYEIRKRLDARQKTARDEDIVALTQHVQRLPDFISLDEDRTGRPRYTSREMLETELAMRNSSDVLNEQWKHGVRTEIRNAAPSAATLGDEQKLAFEHVTRAEGISLVVGYAGTGKSTMLGAAREAWEAQGYRVRGASLSSMAAKSLQDGSAIKSRTLKSLLYSLENVDQQYGAIRDLDDKLSGLSTARGPSQRRKRFELQAQRDQRMAQIDATRLTSRDVVVLDEAAMVGSRDIAKLLSLVEKAGAKAVLVGDAEQLQAIDAGGAFRALRERHGAVEITEVRRQKEQWQKQATKDFAQSFTDEALEAYKSRGFLHQADTHAAARSRMVTAWTDARRKEPEQSQLMMAFTRDDVSELNKEARAAFRAEGRIGDIDTRIATDQGAKDFAKGDRLYFLQNDLRLGVMNGSLGTLENIQTVHTGKKGHRLTVKLDTGDSVTFDSGDYDKFSHGYAATIHKAQGITVDRAYLLASQYMDRHSAYVGMTRHRESVNMYYGDDEFGSYARMTAKLSRDRRKDTTLDYLSRAEKEGRAESFWQKVRRVVPQVVATIVQKPTLAERLQAREQMTAEQRREEREQARKQRELRAILHGFDRKKSRDFSL